MPDPQFGEIDGFPEGTEFTNRKELSDAYLHRPNQAGIWGNGANGAYSIVLSGGYVDDRDYGDEIIYTGQGGRSLETGRQIAHQKLERGNLGLAKNHAEGIPVRVIRGSQHKSENSPAFGYRYDGLYRVSEYWREKGADGFDVWRFRLLKIDSTASVDDGQIQNDDNPKAPTRSESTILRIVRDTKVSRRVKELYDYRCQVCNLRIETPGGAYAEGAHIRPLGRPHNGSDSIDNILCLCPNHHVMFDNFGFTISDDFSLIGIHKILNVHSDHHISIENVRYHREHCYKNPLDR